MKNLIYSLVLLISPALSAQDTLIFGSFNESIKDAWIWSFPVAANSNFGEFNPSAPDFHKVIRSESWQWEAGRNDTIRGLIQFDLGDLTVGEVAKAELDLWHYSNPRFTKQVGENALDLHLITENWNEGDVTWNNQPAILSLAEQSFPRSTSNEQDYIKLDVTELIRSYIAEGAHGIMLKLKEEEPFAGLSFASTEHPNASLHPELRIIMTTNNIEHNGTFEQIRCYPNPTGTVLYVEMERNMSINLELLNISGKVVWHKLNNQGSHLFIPISHLPKGVYLLKSEGGEQEFSERVIIH